MISKSTFNICMKVYLNCTYKFIFFKPKVTCISHRSHRPIYDCYCYVFSF